MQAPEPTGSSSAVDLGTAASYAAGTGTFTVPVRTVAVSERAG